MKQIDLHYSAESLFIVELQFPPFPFPNLISFVGTLCLLFYWCKMDSYNLKLLSQADHSISFPPKQGRYTIIDFGMDYNIFREKYIWYISFQCQTAWILHEPTIIHTVDVILPARVVSFNSYLHVTTMLNYRSGSYFVYSLIIYNMFASYLIHFRKIVIIIGSY